MSLYGTERVTNLAATDKRIGCYTAELVFLTSRRCIDRLRIYVGVTVLPHRRGATGCTTGYPPLHYVRPARRPPGWASAALSVRLTQKC